MTSERVAGAGSEVRQQPALPLFTPGEVKALHIEFEERAGTVLISVASEGMAQDPNQIALFLNFALEKLLDADA